MKVSNGVPGWIDFSPAMQRLTRNAIAALSVPGAIDELGIGVYRDTLADLLFPGTTVTMTRAVYLAFLPACMYETEIWLYKEWEKNHIVPSPERYQIEMRQLQNLFCKKNKVEQGIIGRANMPNAAVSDNEEDAHAYIVRYPFSIYWKALCSWDLIPGGKDDMGNSLPMAAYIQRSCDFIHEHNDPEARWKNYGCGERRKSASNRNDCKLFPAEQTFIKERMLNALGNTLLGVIVKNGKIPESFLQDDIVNEIPEEIKVAVADMKFFTVFMQTAFSGYNAILNWDKNQEKFRKCLARFRETYSPEDAANHLSSMRERVGSAYDNTGIFLEEWMLSCFAAAPDRVPDLKLLVDREFAKKHGKAKIRKAWGVENVPSLSWDSKNENFPFIYKPEEKWVGMDVLDYRWKETSRLIRDLLTNRYS